MPKLKLKRAMGSETGRAPSSLEKQFMELWDVNEGPVLVPEFAFDMTRKWRADFAHLGTRTLVELEGASWAGGRHTRGAGFQADCEKYLAATLAGWRVIRLTGDMVRPPVVGAIVRFITDVGRREGTIVDQSGGREAPEWLSAA